MSIFKLSVISLDNYRFKDTTASNITNIKFQGQPATPVTGKFKRFSSQHLNYYENAIGIVRIDHHRHP